MHTTRFSPRRIGRPGFASVLAVSASALVACSGGPEPSSAPNPPSSAEAPSSASSEAPSSAGSGTESSAEAPSASVVEATETDFAIDLSETELAAGVTTFKVTNDGGATHDLVVETVEGTDVGATKILAPDTSGTVEVDLAPGTYVVYCSVGNHRGMGMELEITVT